MVFIHLKKFDATRLVCNAINIIETRYNGKVVFLWLNEKKALSKEFNKLLAIKGIIWEPSASDSLEQNNCSERKGGILSMKA